MGSGLIVIVNVPGAPEQPKDDFGVTVTVTVMGTVEVLAAVKLGKMPVPLPVDIPMAAQLPEVTVQVLVAGSTMLPPKVTAIVGSPAQCV